MFKTSKWNVISVHVEINFYQFGIHVLKYYFAKE